MRKSSANKILISVFFFSICILVSVVVMGLASKGEENRKVYVESSILDSVIRITGIYGDVDLSSLFFNKDSFEKNDFLYNILKERVIYKRDYFETIKDDSGNEVYKYRISEDELGDIASDYGIDDYESLFDKDDIICSDNDDKSFFVASTCGDGYTKYFIFEKSNREIMGGLFPRYSHNFKLYENNDGIILEDQMRVTYEPTDEKKEKRIVYTFSKNGDRYYLKEIK